MVDDVKDEPVSKKEEVIHRGKLSVWSLLPWLIIGVLFLPFMGAGVLFWLYALAIYLTDELVITEQQMLARFGVFGRRTIRWPLDRIVDIEVAQNRLERALGFGSLIVSRVGQDKEPIPGIVDPQAFRQAFVNAREKRTSRV